MADKELVELSDTFENEGLVWLMATDENDVSPTKLCRLIGQGNSIDKALLDFEDYHGMNHRDQVFLSLLDNHRLSESFISNNIHFIYEKEKVAKKAKKCVRQRAALLRQIANLPPSTLQELKKFLQSHTSVRNTVSNSCNPQDLKLVILKANLSSLLSNPNSTQKKLELVHSMMDDYHFQDKENLKRLLETVQEEDPDLLSMLL